MDMGAPSSNNLTQLLLDWSDGNREALDKLMPLVYDELRRMAHRYMRRENPGHTLQTSALVNEAYLRLVDQDSVGWQNRAHFFGVAAQMMRHILVDHARAQHGAKRGGAAQRVTFDEQAVVSATPAAELIALDDALSELATHDPRKGRIVELRFFAGLNIEETAEVMAISSPTVQREWRKARAWLLRALNKRASSEV